MALGTYTLAMQDNPAVSCLAQLPIVVQPAQLQLGDVLTLDRPMTLLVSLPRDVLGI